ncbi:hypothetical protein [Bacteroides hominis]|uniref:hypothetical protein n=1 Tax=Bacteroides hominis TaxID=2763023 RepID=UPI00164C5F69|nr:hypothetical protein [Bacteroides hominis (ex Liu et al. 2022)]MBC5612894.1 hypothetical protein [Bacteroides hominis (ex Liu et al. 2022)]
MNQDKQENELLEVNPKWLRCLDELKNSGICSIESILNKTFIRDVVVIEPWSDFNTGIKNSCLFFVQNASATWEVTGAIMYGSTEGIVLNSCNSAGFFGSGKHIDVYRTSTPGDIMIVNNTSYERTVYYFALKLFS